MKEKIIKIDDQQYLIRKNISIFASRSIENKKDCTILGISDARTGGSKDKEGRIWTTILILKAEDGSLLRKHRDFPHDKDPFTKTDLKRWGMIQNKILTPS